MGYLCYSWLRWRRDGAPPSGTATFAVLFGTQLPDLVDKPLAWGFALLPTGRTLAHSLLAAGLVLGVAWLLAGPARRELVGALGVGWVSHSLVDLVPAVVAGKYAALGSLLWPVTSVPPYETERTVLSHLRAVEVGPLIAVELILVAVAAVVWYRDGLPGFPRLRALTVRAVRAVRE